MKQKLLKIINPILFLLMFIQAVSGFGQRYADVDLYVLFNRIHYPNGVLLVIFLAVHIYLNWAWISMNFFKRRRKA